MNIPNYEQKSISEKETTEMLKYIRKNFKNNKLKFQEVKYVDSSEQHPIQTGWSNLISNFSDYLKLIANVKTKDGTLILSFFNTKYGFYIQGYWTFKIRDGSMEQQEYALPLGSAIVDKEVPEYITEFTIRHAHIFC